MVVLEEALPASIAAQTTPNRVGTDRIPIAAPVPAKSTRRRANVLVADDDPATLLAMEAILGDLDQRLVLVRSGEEALRLMLDDDFAVAILDVRMPGLSGFETARYIRQRKRTEHTPIIFLTGMGADEGDVCAGYFAGAVDFMTKPVVPHILKIKVKVFVDLYLAWEEIKRQSELLRESERRELERQMAEERARFEAERMRHDLNLAARIQQRLFPANPPRCERFDIAGDSQPAEATGGDYFDFFPMGPNIGIAIGDVSGHGIASALTMASTRAYVRALVLGDPRPARVLELANQALADDVADGNFVTLMLAQLDTTTGELTYSGAGHPPAHILSSSGDVKHVLYSQAPPLGIKQSLVFHESRATLAPGDVALFMTDGILEAVDSRATLFGLERALNVVRAHLDQPAREIAHELYNGARRFACHGVLRDDATTIVVKAL
ncbi:MAG TPA: SpoIIE family protein phosphatase [Pirellulales bacterium]|nr:SpoIIE family protein phosphatase [Pirellulales bacterium]